MLGAIRQLTRTLVAFAETRTRLAANELEEQALRFFEIAMWALAALFLLTLAIVLAAVLVVLVFWNSHRVLAAGVLTGVFALAGLVGALMTRARLRERPKFFAATLGELVKDRERIEQELPPESEKPRA